MELAPKLFKIHSRRRRIIKTEFCKKENILFIFAI
jgi:hypothetical protein